MDGNSILQILIFELGGLKGGSGEGKEGEGGGERICCLVFVMGCVQLG